MSLTAVAAMPRLPPEWLTEGRAQWLDAVKGVGDDVVEVASCGQECVRAITSRLATGMRATEKLLEKAGLRCDALDTRASPWQDVLEECGRDFMQHCAAIIEACNTGGDPRLAPRLLGCAVQLAEVLGRTGPLLAGLDAELAVIFDRVGHLEFLYAAVVKRAGAQAEETTLLKAKLEEAEHHTAEAREKHRIAQDKNRAAHETLQAQVRSHREKSRIANESLQASRAEIARKTAELRYEKTERSRNTQCSNEFSSPPRKGRPDVRFDATPSPPRSSSPSQARFRAMVRVASATNKFSLSGVQQSERADVAVASAQHGNHKNASLLDHAEPHAELTTGGRDWGQSSGSGSEEEKNRNVTERLSNPSSLTLGSVWSQQLPQSDPLTTSVQAAFVHLAKMIRETCERHPVIDTLHTEDHDANMPPAAGLQWLAQCVARWADATLAKVEQSLATSVKQAATHLQTLASLCMTEATTVAPATEPLFGAPDYFTRKRATTLHSATGSTEPLFDSTDRLTRKRATAAATLHRPATQPFGARGYARSSLT
jgi:hypothetical protein